MRKGHAGSHLAIVATALVVCLGWGFPTSVQAVGFQSQSGAVSGSSS